MIEEFVRAIARLIAQAAKTAALLATRYAVLLLAAVLAIVFTLIVGAGAISLSVPAGGAALAIAVGAVFAVGLVLLPVKKWVTAYKEETDLVFCA